MPPNVLDALPDVEGFRRLMQSFAALDAILSPEPQDRYYSFDATWSNGQMMASMRDGSGDQWFAIITSDGVALHGLAHESRTFESGSPKPWVFGSLPGVFHACLLDEPAFDTANSTYCVWRLRNAGSWERGDVPTLPPGHDDGLDAHLDILVRGPEGYRQWAESYFDDVRLTLADAEAVFEHQSITSELAARINPEVDFDALDEDLRAIGYPSN